MAAVVWLSYAGSLSSSCTDVMTLAIPIRYDCAKSATSKLLIWLITTKQKYVISFILLTAYNMPQSLTCPWLMTFGSHIRMTQYFFNEIYSFSLHPDHSFPFPDSPMPPTSESTPPLFLFKNGQTSHGWQQSMAFQLQAGLTSSPVLRLTKATEYVE